MNSIQLGRRTLTPTSEPYIIAEIGVNHGGSMEKAKLMIDLAKEGGADAAKFQSYKAETLASKHSPAYWDTTKEATLSQFQLFKKYDSFNKEDYVELAGYCKKKEIDFVSTPFDDQAIVFLDGLVPYFKIASADLTNLPFLRKVAKTGKPVVLSTGASTLAEVDLAVNELTRHGCTQLALLHCVLNYPTADENANLDMIGGLLRAYPELIIGYSDHTIPDESMMVLASAYMKGAVIIEKHFTYDKTLPGNDHYHAMDVNDLKKFCAVAKRIKTISGATFKSPLPSEDISRKNARRSIVLTVDVVAGTVLSESMLTYKRPGTGISPLFWDQVMGKKVVRDLEKDSILQWGDIQQ